jgi:hypothetical protein
MIRGFVLAALALAFVADASAQAMRPGSNPNRFAPQAQNNRVVVVQAGDGNAAGVVQRGQEQTAVIGQFGNDNAACIVTWGRGTSANIIQTGDGQATLVFRTPTRQRVFEGPEAEARIRRACGF